MADTVTLLSTESFAVSNTLIGEKVKGDAYFGQSDGLHTILVDLNDFIGKVELNCKMLRFF